MIKPDAPVPQTERKVNFGILVVVRVVALALGVLAVAGIAVNSIDYNQAFPMLMVAFVLLCLADLQDTFALNRIIKSLEGRSTDNTPHSAGFSESSESGEISAAGTPSAPSAPSASHHPSTSSVTIAPNESNKSLHSTNDKDSLAN